MESFVSLTIGGVLAVPLPDGRRDFEKARSEKLLHIYDTSCYNRPFQIQTLELQSKFSHLTSK